MAGNFVKAKKLDLDLIRTDGGTQSRAAMDQDVINEYADKMRAGRQFPDLEVYFDGEYYWLVDGFHRVFAAKRAGLKQYKALVRDGSQREAWLASRGKNEDHGLRRSNADKRYAVKSMLLDAECVKWTDGRIADQCGVNSTMVSDVRAELVASTEIPEIEDRLAVRNGNQYVVRTKKIGSKSKTSREAFEEHAKKIGAVPTDPQWWLDWHEYKTHQPDFVHFACIGEQQDIWLAFEGDAAKLTHLIGCPMHKFALPGDTLALREAVKLYVPYPNPEWWDQVYEALSAKVNWYPEEDRTLWELAGTIPFPGEEQAEPETIEAHPAEAQPAAPSGEVATITSNYYAGAPFPGLPPANTETPAPSQSDSGVPAWLVPDEQASAPVPSIPAPADQSAQPGEMAAPDAGAPSEPQTLQATSIHVPTVREDEDPLASAMRILADVLPQLITVVDEACDRVTDGEGKLLARLLKQSVDSSLGSLLKLVEKIAMRPVHLARARELLESAATQDDLRQSLDEQRLARLNNAGLDREADYLRDTAHSKMFALRNGATEQAPTNNTLFGANS